MLPDGELVSAIDNCYAVFAKYPRPSKLDASPVRDGAAILRTLSVTRLRDLTGEQIGPYAGWAMTTVGNAFDYKHFLPRVLEQAVREPLWLGTEPWMVAEHIQMAGWEQWPHVERKAISQLYALAWQQTKSLHPNEGDATEWLCGMALLGEDIARALTAWLSQPVPNAALQVARFLTSDATELGRASGIWAKVNTVQRETILAWLLSDNVRQILEKMADRVPTEDRWMIDHAIAVVGAR